MHVGKGPLDGFPRKEYKTSNEATKNKKKIKIKKGGGVIKILKVGSEDRWHKHRMRVVVLGGFGWWW